MFTIKEEELAAALEISVEKLYEVIDFFDSDPDDEWELKEHDHFVYSNQEWRNRIFSAQGAFAIAKYLDTHRRKSILDRIREFITHHKEKIRNAFVQRTVHENSSSLMPRNGRHFLSKKDTVAILSTSYARLNKAFEVLRRSDLPLQIGVDFDDIEGVRYYSLSGFYRLSENLSQTLTRKDRREWCKAVDVVGRKAFRAIISEQESRKNQIEKAKKAAKRRDRNTCQITLVRQTRHNHNFALSGHHIFSSQYYPHLATLVDNIITLESSVHKEFHSWNGGSTNPCTVDDLVQFVCERYPENNVVIAKLAKIQRIFAHVQPPSQRRASAQRLLPEQQSGQQAA
ncbi:hypothetical protein S7335_2963 [Synechococcus sp. PCC 7335]|uniref:hypothetical protein n=1 Tax=Synechococcus sp. (strain ATCC 29403 / PCC 7335) TaxID=91464 RepID=UPI00017EC39F|nr:hypothetical protein [Synechococcus sp. PCC 7335]EDX85264.1 hypothetical protein S7335_2963 [Synechococcus sp. PCC 7335]